MNDSGRGVDADGSDLIQHEYTQWDVSQLGSIANEKERSKATKKIAEYRLKEALQLV
jgi:hypothetical protein